ncbi:leucine-rich repeat-containing protein 71-like isoform X2 [Narcine bancroftii]|uniref:leucine-rich repeat-containing protein 71-like isoform X2 n=1 Tax=Narcine bancroftii TaxID=1343680 RepID=UPI00383137C5
MIRKPSASSRTLLPMPSTPSAILQQSTARARNMGKKVDKAVKEKAVNPVEEEGPRNPEDYICTGNLEVDFTELCNRMEILEFPLVVPRHPAPNLSGLLEEMQSLTASDKSTPSSAAGGREHISCFRPSVQVEMENDDPKLVKAVYIRAWLIDQKYVFILQKCLPALSSLHTVSLWNVGLAEDTFSALIAVLRQCTNLRIQNLTLRNNKIDDTGAKLIGEALSTPKQSNRTLLSLNLNFNHISDQGIGYIADGLRLNRMLLWLSVAHNRIGDKGAMRLAEVLSPFALTHEEIVEQRLLQLSTQERQPSSSVRRRAESKSERSSQLGSSTALDRLDKSQKSGKATGKKKDKKETAIPDKVAPSVSQAMPKRDDGRVFKRGSFSADIRMSKTKLTRSAKDKHGFSPENEPPGLQHPLLEPAEHRDGQVYLAGNTCLMSLNLSCARSMENKRNIQIIEWEDLDKRKFYLFGLLMTMVIRLSIYPFTLIRTRLQVQKGKSLYSGTFDAFGKILRSEGPAGLYRGFLVNTFTLISGQCYVTTYELTRKYVARYHSSNAVKSVIAGGSASLVAQSITVPIDVVSQHLMVRGQAMGRFGECPAVPTSGPVARRLFVGHTKEVMAQIFRLDGLRGFYRGYAASLMTYIPNSALWWPFYHLYAEQLSYVTPTVCPHLVVQAVAGPLAAATSSTLTNPMDVIRARVQVEGRHSMLQTFKQLIVEEGAWGLTKGLSARILSSTPSAICIVVGYETLKKLSLRPELVDSRHW